MEDLKKCPFCGGEPKVVEDNTIEGLATEINPLLAPSVDGLLSSIADLNDGFDEYIVSLSGSYQLTDATQVSLYGEYTFDDAHNGSQNGTDVKAELGVRVNVQF